MTLKSHYGILEPLCYFFVFRTFTCTYSYCEHGCNIYSPPSQHEVRENLSHVVQILSRTARQSDIVGVKPFVHVDITQTWNKDQGPDST